VIRYFAEFCLTAVNVRDDLGVGILAKMLVALLAFGRFGSRPAAAKPILR